MIKQATTIPNNYLEDRKDFEGLKFKIAQQDIEEYIVLNVILDELGNEFLSYKDTSTDIEEIDKVIHSVRIEDFKNAIIRVPTKLYQVTGKDINYQQVSRDLNEAGLLVELETQTYALTFVYVQDDIESISILCDGELNIPTAIIENTKDVIRSELIDYEVTFTVIPDGDSNSYMSINKLEIKIGE